MYNFTRARQLVSTYGLRGQGEPVQRPLEPFQQHLVAGVSQNRLKVVEDHLPYPACGPVSRLIQLDGNNLRGRARLSASGRSALISLQPRSSISPRLKVSIRPLASSTTTHRKISG